MFYPSGLTAAGLLVVLHRKVATQSHTLDCKELAVALDVAKGTVLAPARVMVISTQYCKVLSSVTLPSGRIRSVTPSLLEVTPIGSNSRPGQRDQRT